ncbi:hypothetical protein A2U01_0040561, partial [Trifolium medium]|nr:hypothetical protein [Trifolium medium]
TPKLICLGSKHGEHNTQLVFRQQQINASLKLSLQNGRSSDPPL